MKLGRLPALSLLLLLGAGPAAAGAAPNPECAWSERFGASDLWQLAEAMVVWDDGTGEALYVGGSTLTAGGRDVGFIARWDGSSWSPLTGPSGTGVDNTVWDLEVYDDGGGPALYVAGAFHEAGGLPAEFIARWDGSEWSALPAQPGPGFLPPITELEVFDDGSGPVLVTAPRMNAWDGSSWSALGSGLGGGFKGVDVSAMEVFDDGGGPALYVGGFFETAGGVPAANLARWDGSAWSAVHGAGAAGPDSGVLSLAVFDDGTGPALYAGGWFEHVGGIPAQGLARWNGTAWSAVAEPLLGGQPLADALVVHDDGSGPALWIGGRFRQIGGVLADDIARWDGQSFSEPAAGGIDGSIRAMAVWDDGTGAALYVGGALTEAGDTAVGHIARLAGGSWSRLGAGAGDGMNSNVEEFAIFDDGTGPSVYAAGEFTLGGDAEVFHVARWTGAGWAPLGDARLGGSVLALEVFDDGTGPALYAGGEFLTLDGEQVPSLARWDGVGWSLVDPANPLRDVHTSFELPGNVFSLGVYDDGTGAALYVGGDFDHVGDQPIERIVRWDGSSWAGLGGVVGTVLAFEVWDDGAGAALYAAGTLSEAGGVETPLRIARWDGASWSAPVDPDGDTVVGGIRALAVFDDGTGSALYAGGGFFTDDPAVFIFSIARWDGNQWTALGTAPAAGVEGGAVNALEVFDDGTGAALYAGGSFEWFVDQAVRTVSPGLARWDATGWSTVVGPGGPGMAVGQIGDLLADPSIPALWAGGSFPLAGGVPSNYVARWTCGEEEEPGLRYRFVGFF